LEQSLRNAWEEGLLKGTKEGLLKGKQGDLARIEQLVQKGRLPIAPLSQGA
jgi:hypothetical protein